MTARDGHQSKLETVYIRGSMIRFIIVPDMLQQAPMFKRVGPNAMKGRGIGSARGRATIMRGRCLGSPWPSACMARTLHFVLTPLLLSSFTQQRKADEDVVVLALRQLGSVIKRSETKSHHRLRSFFFVQYPINQHATLLCTTFLCDVDVYVTRAFPYLNSSAENVHDAKVSKRGKQAIDKLVRMGTHEV